MQQLSPPTLQSTDILQVYDRSSGALLILGKPGSGKTILLLELTRTLLDRAKHDDAYPIPIVFHLSSWAKKRSPFSDWLVEELQVKYHVGRKIGRSWVANDQVSLLLDGLDEVGREHRTACIETINLYRQEHGLTPMVVCCRDTDYLDQTGRLQLGGAVMIQPLTQQQIDEYLSNRGERVTGVRLALRQDTELREITTTPLMLTTLALAYENVPAEDVVSLERTESLPKQILAQYIKRMLGRRGTSEEYAHEQTMRWLTWLACRMQHHNLTEFYMERMQPEWLPTQQWLRRYTMLLSVILLLLIGPLNVWTFSQILLSPTNMQIDSILIYPFTSFQGLLFLHVFSKDLRRINPAEIVLWSRERWSRYIRYMLFYMLTGGAFIWLIFHSPLAWLAGMLLGLAFSILTTLISGPESSIGDVRSFTKPNYGIQLSLQHGLSAGIKGFLSGTCSGLAVGLLYGPMTGLSIGLVLGLYLGVCFGLGFGGRAYLQHKCLLLFLQRLKKIPSKYSHFLDYATERILLRKVGGGYAFLHRALLDYFASLETTQPSQAPTLVSSSVFTETIETHEHEPENILAEKQPKLVMKGRDRNTTCPCGSGKKYKKCCGR